MNDNACFPDGDGAFYACDDAFHACDDAFDADGDAFCESDDAFGVNLNYQKKMYRLFVEEGVNGINLMMGEAKK